MTLTRRERLALNLPPAPEWFREDYVKNLPETLKSNFNIKIDEATVFYFHRGFFWNFSQKIATKTINHFLTWEPFYNNLQSMPLNTHDDVINIAREFYNNLTLIRQSYGKNWIEVFSGLSNEPYLIFEAYKDAYSDKLNWVKENQDDFGLSNYLINEKLTAKGESLLFRKWLSHYEDLVLNEGEII